MEQIGSLLTNIFKPDGPSAASSATPPEPAAAPAAAAADAPVVIAVIGAGRMGTAIAAQLALGGSAAGGVPAVVRMWDHSDFTRGRAKNILEALLREAVEAELLTPALEAAAAARVSVAPTLDAACGGADLVLEAAIDDVGVKTGLFKRMGAASSAAAVLATNSIAYGPAEIEGTLRDAVDGPAQRANVCGVRFLHPVLFMQPVEVTTTDDELRARASALLARVGLEPFGYGADGSRPGYLPRRRLDEPEVAAAHAAQRGRVQAALAAAADGAPPTAAAAARADGPQCAVCMDAPVEVIFSPCGHAVACRECAATNPTRRCFNCRANIERELPVGTSGVQR